MKIILNDGTEIENAIAGEYRNQLCITMSETDAVASIARFMDKDVTDAITFVSGIWNTIFHHFNRFLYMEKSHEDEMQVWMEGKEDEIIVEKQPRFDEAYMPKGDE